MSSIKPKIPRCNRGGRRRWGTLPLCSRCLGGRTILGAQLAFRLTDHKNSRGWPLPVLYASPPRCPLPPGRGCRRFLTVRVCWLRRHCGRRLHPCVIRPRGRNGISGQEVPVAGALLSPPCVCACISALLFCCFPRGQGQRPLGRGSEAILWPVRIGGGRARERALSMSASIVCSCPVSPRHAPHSGVLRGCCGCSVRL